MTLFTDLIGNEGAKNRLTHFLDTSYLPSSLLFKGVKGVGKGMFAREFAKAVVGSSSLKSHPDIVELFPEGKTGIHSKEALNSLCEEVYLLPYAGKKRVFIVHDAEKMQSVGSNSLLKTLEDPAPSSLLLLTSSEPWSLLKTIHSRMFSLSFSALNDQQVESFLKGRNLPPDLPLEIVVKLAKGSISRALFFAEGRGLAIRESLLDLLLTTPPTFFYLKKKIEGLDLLLKESAEKSLLLKDEKNYLDEENLPKKGVEKEVMQFFLELLLSLFKDFYLLKQAESSFFLHTDKKEVLKNLQITPFSTPFPVVLEKKLEDFRLSLDRNTPLSNALETLFLGLDLF